MFRCLYNKNALFLNGLELKETIFHVSSRNLPEQVIHPFKMKSKKNLERHKSYIERINLENQDEVLSDIVTPCWKMSYEEELDYKQKMCEETLEFMFHKLSKNKESIQKILERIIPSPVRDAYRNKDDFNIWTGVDGNPKTVGFFVGIPAVGKVVSVPATSLKCIKESHKNIAQVYQDLVRSSPLPASYQLHDGGFWRSVLVRSNDAGDHMAFVVTHPSNLSPAEITEQQHILTEHFAKHSPTTALFHQSCPHVRCTRELAKINHLRGLPHLMETLAGRTFRISPDSFFQSNKAAAEIMYQVVLRMARLKHYTTLLDLYCGTGAVSLLASEQVRGCIGIDQVTAAVDDAKHNAEINNVTNCSFLGGKVEVKLAQVLSKLEYSPDIVAIVNPGRAGAGEGVISLLRKNPHISRVVYVSCKPDNPLTMKNFIQLCETMGSSSKPFILRKAVPIDLFPYTSNYELVLCFDKT